LGRLTATVARLFGMSAAIIVNQIVVSVATSVDGQHRDDEAVVSIVGMNDNEPAVLAVPDTVNDERFSPWTTVRSYCGTPLITPEGYQVSQAGS
jgi:hypothetical protein